MTGIGGDYDQQVLAFRHGNHVSRQGISLRPAWCQAPTTDEISLAQAGNYGFVFVNSSTNGAIYVTSNNVVKLP